MGVTVRCWRKGKGGGANRSKSGESSTKLRPMKIKKTKRKAGISATAGGYSQWSKMGAVEGVLESVQKSRSTRQSEQKRHEYFVRTYYCQLCSRIFPPHEVEIEPDSPAKDWLPD